MRGQLLSLPTVHVRERALQATPVTEAKVTGMGLLHQPSSIFLPPYKAKVGDPAGVAFAKEILPGFQKVSSSLRQRHWAVKKDSLACLLGRILNL